MAHLQGRDLKQRLVRYRPLENYVLKTATGGYDGHGQKVIRSEEDLEEAYALADSADCVLEEFVNFDLEISVSCLEMAGRDSFPVGKISTATTFFQKPLCLLAFQKV